MSHLYFIGNGDVQMSIPLRELKPLEYMNLFTGNFYCDLVTVKTMSLTLAAAFSEKNMLWSK